MPLPPDPLPPMAGPATQADADARYAWALGLSLGDQASQEHTNAVVSLLLAHVHADITRLNAAVALCRSRHLPDEEDGYPQAEQLIDHARQRLTAAQADNDPAARERLREQLHAQAHPEPVPYEWDHHRRRQPRWWLRHLTTRRLTIRHAPARSPAGIQRLTGELRRRPAALPGVRRVPTDSRRQDHHRFGYQGLGIGTRLVLHAFARYPFYTWHTTAQ